MIETSVIIPCLNEESYIEACVQSIIRCTYPKDRLEVFFVDGGSSDRTREILAEYANDHAFIHVLENEDRTPPYALNLGIDAARGEFIMRMDAHSAFPPEYIERLVDWSRRLGAENVGAVCVTDVMHRTPRSLAIRSVLGDPLGVGNSHFRTGVDEVKQVDTVPFGCYPRRVFEDHGRFDVRLSRNQDIEFNKRIIRAGARIFLVPDVKFTYYARESLGGLWNNNFANGKWNVLTGFLTGDLASLSLRHFVPLIFVTALAGSAVVSVFWSPALLGFVSVAAAYLIAIGARSCLIVDPGSSIPATIMAFVTLHFAYGIGSLAGLLAVMRGGTYRGRGAEAT